MGFLNHSQTSRKSSRPLTRCACCLKPIRNAKDNTCAGCGEIVCVNCCSEFGHILGEKHIIPRRLVERIEVYERVLRLVDGYLSNQPQHILLGFDGGLMTWAELREHIVGALDLSPRKKKTTGRKRKQKPVSADKT